MSSIKAHPSPSDEQSVSSLAGLKEFGQVEKHVPDSREKVLSHSGWLWAVVLLSGISCYFSISAGLSWSGDFALYYRQAESILQGSAEQLLAFNRYAMEQSVYKGPPIGPHLYPWGFPLLLSPILALFGPQFVLMKMYMAGFLLLSVVVVWHLFKVRLGRGYTLLLVALVGLNPYLVNSVNSIKSDLPFLFFSLLSLLFIQKVIEERWILNKALTYILTGLIMAAAFLVRANGIVLVAVLFLSQLVVHREALRANFMHFLRHNLSVFLPYLGFAVGVALVKGLLPGGSNSYLSFFADLTPGKFISHLLHYLVLPTRFYTDAVGPAGYIGSLLIYAFTVPFALLGAYRRLSKDFHYILLVCIMMAIVILFPIPVYLRLIFPVFPLYLYFTFLGMIEAERIWKKTTGEPGKNWGTIPFRQAGWKEMRHGVRKPIKVRRSRFLSAFGIAILGLFIIRTSGNAIGNMNRGRLVNDGPTTVEGQEMLGFIKNHTPPEAEIVFHMPRMLTMFTQRQSLLVTDVSALEEGKGDYLVFQKGNRQGRQVTVDEFYRLKSSHPVRFENQKFVVLQLKE
jgi:hypothetical protein